MKIKFDIEIDDAIIDLAIEKARKNGGLVPKARGYWELIMTREDMLWQCTECDSKYTHKSNFCPNCGADMRHENEG